MAIYHPYVDAVQWLGTNVTEIRQFVRANAGLINSASVHADGVLYLEPTVGAESLAIPVNVNDWVVRSGVYVFTLSPTVFAATYQP